LFSIEIVSTSEISVKVPEYGEEFDEWKNSKDVETIKGKWKMLLFIMSPVSCTRYCVDC